MPPRRKGPGRRASTGKNASTQGSLVNASPATTSSGRPVRSGTQGIDYKLTRARASNGSPHKKLAKSREDGATRKAATSTADAAPKRRGRPPKDTAVKPVAKAPEAKTPAKRGRPPKAVTSAAATPPAQSSKRKRETRDEPAEAPAKKRGRPPKAIATGSVATDTQRKTLSKKVEKQQAANIKSKTATTSATKKRTGRVKSAEPHESDDKFIEAMTQEPAEAPEYQYWLMKAEPDSRIVKGVDVAFSIDKLAEAVEPEPWDGVRNPVARNHMRAMRKGDLAFFYHSNCSVPGIVGVMRVAEEHKVDESAFDPAHPYFDEKSDRSKPKWDCVKVEFVKKFETPITLRELKSTPELAEMKIAQKAFGRLSVQNVAQVHWKFVLKIANEPEDLGVVSPVSGYEADTNGETDAELPEPGANETSEGVDDEGPGESDKISPEAIAAYGRADGDTDKDDKEDETEDENEARIDGQAEEQLQTNGHA